MPEQTTPFKVGWLPEFLPPKKPEELDSPKPTSRRSHILKNTALSALLVVEAATSKIAPPHLTQKITDLTSRTYTHRHLTAAMSKHQRLKAWAGYLHRKHLDISRTADKKIEAKDSRFSSFLRLCRALKVKTNNAWQALQKTPDTFANHIWPEYQPTAERYDDNEDYRATASTNPPQMTDADFVNALDPKIRSEIGRDFFDLLHQTTQPPQMNDADLSTLPSSDHPLMSNGSQDWSDPDLSWMAQDPYDFFPNLRNPPKEGNARPRPSDLFTRRMF